MIESILKVVLKPKNVSENWGFEPVIRKRPDFSTENSIFLIEFLPSQPSQTQCL